MTVSSETREINAVSSAYTLLASDGDTVEVQVAASTIGSDTKAMLYFKATTPGATDTGYVIQSERQGTLVYTLSGVNLYGRAFGTAVRFLLNGTMTPID